MAESQYIFQKRRTSFTKQIFNKGLTTAGIILLYLKEVGEGFVEDLPSCYPQLDLVKKLTKVGPYRKRRREWLKKKNLQNSIYRLEKQGLVVKDPKRKIYCLTDEGKKFVAHIKDRYGVLSKKWDGKIRMVIFDIPEKKRKKRVWLRNELLLLQYKEFQKSVYIGKALLPRSLYQEIAEAGLDNYVSVFTMGKYDKKQIMKILGDGKSTK